LECIPVLYVRGKAPLPSSRIQPKQNHRPHIIVCVLVAAGSDVVPVLEHESSSSSPTARPWCKSLLLSFRIPDEVIRNKFAGGCLSVSLMAIRTVTDATTEMKWRQKNLLQIITRRSSRFRQNRYAENIIIQYIRKQNIAQVDNERARYID
jgi:hypothetical protein